MNPPGALLFLGFGATEFVIVIILFVLLFGVDKVPEIARTVGRMQGQWNRMRRQMEREMKTPLERQADDISTFERHREMQVKQTWPGHQEELRLREAGRALGIPGAETMDVPRLKREISALTGAEPDESGEPDA